MNITDLSKTISYALRHKPEEYGLTLDSEGFVWVEELRDAIRKTVPKYANIELADIYKAAACSDKKRHEILNGKIRAYYGHSCQNMIEHEAATPPDVLFHGTNPALWETIQQEGLRPMTRQMVHLSSDRATAEIVGKRKADVPMILRVDAKRAAADGVVFFIGNDDIWLAETVPAKYIEQIK